MGERWCKVLSYYSWGKFKAGVHWGGLVTPWRGRAFYYFLPRGVIYCITFLAALYCLELSGRGREECTEEVKCMYEFIYV